MFKRFRRGANEPTPNTTAAAGLLGQLFEARTSDDDRIRVEDLLSASAAACGEACLVAAGIIDVDRHELAPGSPVFSDAVNAILSRDTTDWADTAGSVFGRIREGAIAGGYPPEAFPDLAGVYRVLAGGAGSVPWGWVPLSVPEVNRPRVQPLRDAFELRTPVREILDAHSVTADERPLVIADAIVIELGRVRTAIEPGVAVAIVLETINGMAKTAPMTEAALQAASGAATSPQSPSD